MAFRSAVFISANHPELTVYRDEVRKTVKDMDLQPVEQLDYSIDYGPLHGLLQSLMATCEAVIHIVGRSYGREPAERTLGAPTRSYSIFEFDVAQFLKKPIYCFLARPNALLDPMPAEDAEHIERLNKHRAAIQASGMFWKEFSTVRELVREVERLRRSLVVRKSMARLPFQPLAENFIGRKALLQQVREALEEHQIAVLHSPEKAYFRGGTGKTTLAVEIAWQLYSERRVDFAIHVPARSKAQLDVGLAGLARGNALALIPDETPGFETRLQSVLKWFEKDDTAGRWLLILDGVDDPATFASVVKLLPKFRFGPVLITSRMANWTEVPTFPVPPFGPESAAGFIAKKVPEVPDRAGTSQASVASVASLLGNNALLLGLAAAYMRSAGQTAADFVKDWDSRARASRTGLPSPNPLMPRKLEPLATVWSMACELLEPAELAFMQVLSCFLPDPMSVPVAVWQDRSDWARSESALRALHTRGLVLWDREAARVMVPQPVREVCRDTMAPEEVSTALATAMHLMDEFLTKATGSPDSWTLCEWLTPHCRAILGQTNGHPLASRALRLSHALAEWFRTCGRYHDAELLHRRALYLEEKVHGPLHESVGERLQALGNVLSLQRKTMDAIDCLQRAVEAFEQSVGLHHPKVAGILQMIGSTLRAADALEEAERFFRRALAIDELHWGSDHTRTAIRMHNLASLLEARGQLLEAECLYRKALAADESTFAPTHPKVSIRLHHLAIVLAARRQFDEAEALMKRGLKIDAVAFGKDHVEYGAILKNLAFLYMDTKRFREAETTFREALVIDEKHFGEKHRETAVTRQNLGCVLQALGEVPEALDCFRLAVEVLGDFIPALHGPSPHLATVRRNLEGLSPSPSIPEVDSASKESAA